MPNVILWLHRIQRRLENQVRYIRVRSGSNQSNNGISKIDYHPNTQRKRKVVIESMNANMSNSSEKIDVRLATVEYAHEARSENGK